MVPAERDQVRELFDPMPHFAKSLELNPYNDTALISRAREYKYRGLTFKLVDREGREHQQGRRGKGRALG